MNEVNRQVLAAPTETSAEGFVEFFAEPTEAELAQEPNFTFNMTDERNLLRQRIPVRNQEDQVTEFKLGQIRWVRDRLKPITGGVHAIYRAWDGKLRKFVAIKAEQEGDHERDLTKEERQKRLLAESRALANLQHTNLLHVYDLTLMNEQLCFVMDWVGSKQGIDMADFLIQVRKGVAEPAKEGDFMPVRSKEMILKTMQELCDVVTYLCESERAHFDLKPGNILLTKDGVKLIDFGLSQKISTWGGTPVYMSPEATYSQDYSTELDHPADTLKSEVFSLALICYELLAKQRIVLDHMGPMMLFSVPTRDVASIGDAAFLHELAELGIPEDRQAELVACLQKTLSPVPADRYTPQEFSQELSRILGQSSQLTTHEERDNHSDDW